MAGTTAATISALENNEREFIQDGTLSRLREAIDRIASKNTTKEPHQVSRGLPADHKVFVLSKRSMNRVVRAISDAEEKADRMWHTIAGEILENMVDTHWREFESDFLKDILTAEGYQNIAITQASRDGGIDAHCTDLQGRKVHVSAKLRQQSVGPGPVREIRGTGGDLAVLVCPMATKQALNEAATPPPGLPPVRILSDFDLVRACLKAGLIADIGIVDTVIPTVKD